MAHRTLTLLLLVACSSSRAVIGRDAAMPDAGVPALDAGEDALVPPADAGPPPTGVCAEAASAAPLGVLAVRMEGDVLLGLEAGGTERRLHRVFADVATRGEVATAALLATPERIAGVASAELDCARPSCPRATEAFVLGPAGVSAIAVDRPAGFRDPSLTGITGDGLLRLRLIRERTFASFTRLLDVSTGEVLGDLGCCTSLAGTGEADAEGWRPATLAAPDDVRTRPGFVRFVAGTPETRELGLDAAQAWRDAWVSWDELGVHIDRVSGRRSVRVARDVGPRTRTPRVYRRGGGASDLLELWAEGDLHGAVDLAAERAHLLFEAVASSPEVNVETQLAHGVWLVSAGGAPRHTLELASGAQREHALPAGSRRSTRSTARPDRASCPAATSAFFSAGPSARVATWWTRGARRRRGPSGPACATSRSARCSRPARSTRSSPRTGA